MTEPPLPLGSGGKFKGYVRPTRGTLDSAPGTSVRGALGNLSRAMVLDRYQNKEQLNLQAMIKAPLYEPSVCYMEGLMRRVLKGYYMLCMGSLDHSIAHTRDQSLRFF